MFLWRRLEGNLRNAASADSQFISTLQNQIPDPDILLDPTCGRNAHPFGLSGWRDGMFDLSFKREMPGSEKRGLVCGSASSREWGRRQL